MRPFPLDTITKRTLSLHAIVRRRLAVISWRACGPCGVLERVALAYWRWRQSHSSAWRGYRSVRIVASCSHWRPGSSCFAFTGHPRAERAQTIAISFQPSGPQRSVLARYGIVWLRPGGPMQGRLLSRSRSPRSHPQSRYGCTSSNGGDSSADFVMAGVDHAMARVSRRRLNRRHRVPQIQAMVRNRACDSGS